MNILSVTVTKYVYGDQIFLDFNVEINSEKNTEIFFSLEIKKKIFSCNYFEKILPSHFGQLNCCNGMLRFPFGALSLCMELQTLSILIKNFAAIVPFQR